MMKRILTVALCMALLCGLVQVGAFASAEEAKQTLAFFSDPEINALIDENYEKVLEEGWAELRIPRSMHGITEDMIDPNALDVAYRLLDAGFEARVIGGAVRDIAMGTETMDFDIVTNATIDEQLALMDDMTLHTIQSGLTFGFVHYGDEIVDLAQALNIPAAFHGLEGVPDFDPEPLYSDNFVFDSFERDLTMNAIYYDVATGDLVDYHGGLHDIREGLLNTMVDPQVELASNPTVAIRALRFKARYGFEFSERLEAAMRSHGREYVLANTPDTFLFQLVRFWPAGYARACYDTLVDYDVFDAIYPPLAGIDTADYMAAATDWMDQWHAQGNAQSDDLAMGAFLWPAVTGAEDIEARAAEVIARENKVFLIDEALAAHYTAMYTMQARLEAGEACPDADELMADPAFEDAYELLLIRCGTEEGLDAAAQYWTAARQAALDAEVPEDYEELAPAA